MLPPLTMHTTRLASSAPASVPVLARVIAAATGAAPAPSAVIDALSASSFTAAATSATVTTIVPASSCCTNGHITGDTPPLPMPSTKLRV